MGRRLDLVGQRFTKLVVLENAGTSRNKKSLVLVRCDCGTEKIMIASQIRSQTNISCGCERGRSHLRRTKVSPRCSNPTYVSWINMKTRCTNTNSPSYQYYGAKGIKFYPEWVDYAPFVAYLGERPPGTSLDRIDPTGDYEPGNVRWATYKEQANNKRNKIRRTHESPQL